MKGDYYNPNITHEISVYDNNGGTVLAIAGEDFAIIAGDTRLSTGYSILSREQSRLQVLSNEVVVGASGFQADVQQLYKLLKSRSITYELNHHQSLSLDCTGQLIQTLLYQRRFFPLYSFTLMAGIDEDGKGAVFSYDAVGTIEKLGYTVCGTGSELVQPILDTELKGTNILVVNPVTEVKLTPPYAQISLERAIDLVKSAFSECAERDIYTGDDVEILILKPHQNIQRQTFPLRMD